MMFELELEAKRNRKMDKKLNALLVSLPKTEME
jgi:hypothetical protein